MMLPAGKSICLIGMMGAGKSTVGPLLAEKLGRPCIDMDSRIESEAGMTISEIFKLQGEEHFRDLERSLLSQIIGKNVIACGGGIITQQKCRTMLGEQSTVYLRADVNVLEARLQGARTRPLLPADAPPSDTVRQMLSQRQQHYESTARWIVDVDDLSPGDIVEIIVKQIEAEPA